MRTEPESAGDADAQLRSLGDGLSVSLLHEALARGQFVVDEVTANHPRNTAAMRRWSETNRALRDLLVPHGWVREDPQGKEEQDGVPTTYLHDRRIAFYATSGNKDTGLLHRIPSTNNPRGSASAGHVMDNHQLELPGKGFGRVLPTPKVRTWILLYFHDVTHDADGLVERELVRAEFSLPIHLSDAGTIIEWKRRIILPPLALSDPDTLNAPPTEVQEIDIPISRRGA